GGGEQLPGRGWRQLRRAPRRHRPARRPPGPRRPGGLPPAPTSTLQCAGSGADRDTVGEAGSWFAERLLTIVASSRQQGRLLLAFLVAAGQAALHASAPPSLLSARQG